MLVTQRSSGMTKKGFTFSSQGLRKSCQGEARGDQSDEFDLKVVSHLEIVAEGIVLEAQGRQGEERLSVDQS